MKTLAIIFCALAFACGLRSEGPTRVDGHGDGEIRLTLSLRILDADSREPLTGVDVRYFSKIELDQIEVIQAEKARVGKSRFEMPQGAIAHSDGDGISKIACVFDAAFLWSFETGERKDIGTDVFPRGRFVMTKGGYESLELEATALLPRKKYTLEQLNDVVNIALRKRPNQALLPTTTAVTPAAEQPARQP